MAADNQSLQYILGGAQTQFGGLRPNFKTNTDFWKQNVAPWVDYYNKPGQSSPAPGDINSPFAQFANSYSQAMLAADDPANADGIQNLVASQQAGRDLNDLYTKAWMSTVDPSLQGILGSQVANKNYAKKQGLDPKAYSQTLSTELTNLMNSGYDIRNASGNTAAHIKRMAPDLARYGVGSLSDLASYQVTNPYTGKPTDVFYNKKTGTIVPTSFGSSMKGEGGSDYKLKNINGQVVPVAKWRDTSEAGDFAPLAMMAGIAAPMFLGPMATSALGLTSGSLGSAAVNAGISGLTSGALSSLSGGDFGKGFLTGAIGSGIGSGISALNPGGSLANAISTPEETMNAMLSKGVNRALSGGLGAGAGALINGRDAGSSALRGALSGGISGLTSGALAEYLGPNLSNTIGGQLGKLATSSLAGSPSRGKQPSSGGLAQAQQAQQANAARRQFRLSGLPEYAQQRVHGGLDKLRGFGADFSDVDFV